MKKGGAGFLGKLLRVYSSGLGGEIVQTRLAVALFALGLVNLTPALDLPAWFNWIFYGYIGLNVLLVFAFKTKLRRKRIRVMPELIDLAVISLLVSVTGGLDSSWFVLYLFPVMSVSRFMGTLGILLFTVLAAAGYAFSTSIFTTDDASLASFALRVLTFGGASLTAANLARTRDKDEAKLVAAIEEIDHLLLAGGDREQVMGRILNTAMELTDSDVSAMILLDGNTITATFSAAVEPQAGSSLGLDKDKTRALNIVREKFGRPLKTGEPFVLPDGGPLARLPETVGLVAKKAQWPGRLVPLVIGEDTVGVLGVFTRRHFHYFTRNDLRKLSSLAPMVAMVQKNAELFRDSRGRLDLLYEIGRQLKTEHGLQEVFNVVGLVSDQLSSEEAALFVPDQAGEWLIKKAVSGPDEVTARRLSKIERSYGPKDKGLTRGVFDSKKIRCDNNILKSEIYADEYSKELPSTITRHYLGVPLIIGDEVLGVIRVLNKKALGYRPVKGETALADRGFRQEDVDLLTFIATQVAAAIRNAKFVEQKHYLENLVYTSPDPIIVVDSRGRVRHFNRACEEIWQQSESDVLGQSVEDFYLSEDHVQEISRLLRSEEEHVLRDHETEIRGPEGEAIPIRLSAALHVDAKGKFLGSIGIFRDQRPILRLEEERIRNEKLAALGRLAQTASHDLKHDFGTILTFLAPLEKKLQNDSNAVDAVQSIRTAALEARDKFQRMLMAARPKPPDCQVISLKTELDKFHNSALRRAAVTRVKFSLKAPESDLIVFADPELLRQVFANLFGNSIDAIRNARQAQPPREVGVIEAMLEETEEQVILTWRDDGCGMSAEVLDRAFTAFFTTKETGSGLGLSVTKTIVENHDGEIFIESEEGVGTTTRITLPHLPNRVEPPQRDDLSAPEEVKL